MTGMLHMHKCQQDATVILTRKACTRMEKPAVFSACHLAGQVTSYPEASHSMIHCCTRLVTRTHLSDPATSPQPRKRLADHILHRGLLLLLQLCLTLTEQVELEVFQLVVHLRTAGTDHAYPEVLSSPEKCLRQRSVLLGNTDASTAFKCIRYQTAVETSQ